MKLAGWSFVTRRRASPMLPWRRRSVFGSSRELESVTSWRLRTLRRAAHIHAPLINSDHLRSVLRAPVTELSA